MQNYHNYAIICVFKYINVLDRYIDCSMEEIRVSRVKSRRILRRAWYIMRCRFIFKSVVRVADS